MNAKIFLFICLFLFYSVIKAQTIEANHEITIVQIDSIKDDAEYSNFRYGLHVRSFYSTLDNFPDSISLFVKNVAIELGPSDVQIYITDKNFERHVLYSDWHFSNGNLKIHTKELNSTAVIELRYNYIGSVLMFFNENNYNKIYIFGGSDLFDAFSSMFFFEDEHNICHKSFKTRNLTPLKDFNTFNACRCIYNSEINNTLLYLIDTSNVYNRYLQNIAGKEYDYYIRNEDSLLFNTFKKKHLRNLDFLFLDYKPADKIKYTVVDLDLKSKSYAMGKTYYNSILFDKSFLDKNAQSLIHELLHSLLNGSTTNDNVVDGYYIINESLIEYLSVYVTYFDDSINFQKLLLEKDSLYRENRNSERVSLYEIRINEKNNFSIIYDHGAFLFFSLAKKIGYAKFFDFSIEFFTNNRLHNYNQFISFLRTKGVNKKIIKEFENNCKHKQNL